MLQSLTQAREKLRKRNSVESTKPQALRLLWLIVLRVRAPGGEVSVVLVSHHRHMTVDGSPMAHHRPFTVPDRVLHGSATRRAKPVPEGALEQPCNTPEPR